MGIMVLAKDISKCVSDETLLARLPDISIKGSLGKPAMISDACMLDDPKHPVVASCPVESRFELSILDCLALLTL